MGSGILVLALSEMHIFQPYPDYEITVKINSAENHQQTLSIKNIGLIQTKKVTVHTLSNDNIKMENQSCFELTSNSTVDAKTIKLDFERMSTGMLCDINFITDNKIVGFIITSEDSPTSAYFATIDSSNTNTVIFKNTKQIVQIAYNWVMLAIIIEIIGVSASFVINQQNRKKRLQILEIENNEIVSSVNRYVEEFSLLYERLLLDETLPQRLRARLETLQIKILEQKLKLDENKSKRKFRKKQYDKLKEYFKAWEEFERKIISFTNREKIVIDADITINQIINKINERGKIDRESFVSLKSLMEYRNKVILGSTKITEEFNNNIQKIKELTETLFVQNKSAV